MADSKTHETLVKVKEDMRGNINEGDLFKSTKSLKALDPDDNLGTEIVRKIPPS